MVIELAAKLIHSRGVTQRTGPRKRARTSHQRSAGEADFSSPVIVKRASSGTTMGRFESVNGQMGVITTAFIDGKITGPPAERL